jgi:hypothetical protein
MKKQTKENILKMAQLNNLSTPHTSTRSDFIVLAFDQMLEAA